MSVSTPSTSVPGFIVGAASPAALTARRKAFRALHERGCFVIPNPWDVGSARYLQHLGFPALATTSAGFAFSQGLPDSGDDAVLARDRNLAYIAEHHDCSRSSRERGLHVRVWAGAGGRGRERRSLCRDGRRRPVDRGRHRRFVVAPLRPADRDRACSCRATGDRSIGLRRAADRESRVLPRRPSRSPSRISSTSGGVRGGGSGRALRPGSAESRRHQGARRGGCPEAAQPPRGPGHWPERRARSRHSACDASASAVRWHWRRGPASCAPHRR